MRSGVGARYYSVRVLRTPPKNRVCSLCGGNLCGCKTAALILHNEKGEVAMPFHTECLRMHRGDISLRRKIRRVMASYVTHKKNGGGLK